MSEVQDEVRKKAFGVGRSALILLLGLLGDVAIAWAQGRGWVTDEAALALLTSWNAKILKIQHDKTAKDKARIHVESDVIVAKNGQGNHG